MQIHSYSTTRQRPKILLSFIFLILLLLSSCSSIVSSTANKLANNLAYTILNSDDPKTVKDGAPAYLLLMDSFLVDDKDNTDLLLSGATLYSAYASIFVEQPERAIRMSYRALNYSEQALCSIHSDLCKIREKDFSQFSQLVSQMQAQDLNAWYTFASSWITWIKANSDSMAAVAELPQATLIMEQVAKLDDAWKNGEVHLYLGVLNSLLPPALGGKPEQARKHFEQVLHYSQGKNLMAKVLFAEKYARLVFDQKLHDRLLNEVINADPYVENLTLMNVLAQTQAKELLASSSDYF